jgi:hypothetical protein
MREGGRRGRLLSSALFVTLAAGGCGSSAGGAASQFCTEWAGAFCKRIWACIADPASNPFAGPSEAECAKGWAMQCSQPQPTGQTFEVSCAGKQVNETAKASCLNKLNTVSCTDFNADSYDDDCDLVCTGSATGAGGSTGTGGTTGTGGSTGSGGTSGQSCGGVAPCGGSLVGSWTLTGVCIDASSLTDPTCPGSSVSNVNATESGTLTFTAGGTYTANVSATLSYTEMVPQSCIAPATCADLAAGYAAFGITATCTGTTVCTCNVAFPSSTSTDSGTYTTSGTTVTSTSSTDGDVDVMGYCIQGDNVRFMSFNTAGQVTTEEIGRRQ